MNSAHLLVQLFLFVQLVQLVLLVPLVQLVPLAKAHKILVFVLKKPENGGSGGQKRTKMQVLCSKSQKTGVPKAESAQKPRFCARNARKRRFQTPKAHKNSDFVLESAENRGLEGQKSTKTPILCSGRLGLAPGREVIGTGKRNRCLPANHRAHL